MKRSKSVSIAEIAKQCGFSTMTVSRALRENGAVREQTRQKVLGTAKKLGYIRSPRMGRPANSTNEKRDVIEIIVGMTGDLIPAFHTALITAIEQALANYRCDCVIRTCSNDYEQFVSLRETVRNSKSEAVILLGSFSGDFLKCLLETRPDALLLDNPGDPSIELPYETFCFDNVEAARLGVGHLFDIGRERVLLVVGEPEHFFSREIEHGYREIHQTRGIDVDENLITHTDFRMEGACRAIHEALDADVNFDAVFTNDEMGAGVYRALYERNLRIPDRIAVCGCDGLPIGYQLYPRLTTIQLDHDKLARHAVKHLLRDRESDLPVSRVRLLPSLTVRESTKS